MHDVTVHRPHDILLTLTSILDTILGLNLVDIALGSRIGSLRHRTEDGRLVNR